MTEEVTEKDFQYLKLIGKGGYSEVLMARKKDSGRLYAIKRMNKFEILSKISKKTIVTESIVNQALQDLPFVAELNWAF